MAECILDLNPCRWKVRNAAAVFFVLCINIVSLTIPVGIARPILVVGSKPN